MKKFLFLFPIFLFAFNLDFSKCYVKYKTIYTLIPISKNLSATFNKPPKYLYYDPFTGLYIVKNKNKRFVSFFSNYRLGWWMAAIKKGEVYGGTLAKDMDFLSLAKLSVKSPKNSVISDLFCRAYGIGGGGGFLRGDYVKHFMKYGYWGDIGIDVDNNMRVKYVDPFYVRGIEPGDKILFINSKPANVENFERYVLLSSISKKVRVKTNRGEFILKVRKKIYNFTPLMHFGIIVDRNLNIKKIPQWIYKKYYVSLPAKLISVNSKKITSFEELRYILSFCKNVTITLRKDGVNIKIPLRR